MNARWRLGLALALGFCAGNVSMWCLWYRTTRISTQELVADARQALRNADYEKAETIAARVLALGSKSTAAMLIAGEAAAKRNRLDDAVAYYSQVPDTGNDVAFRALSSKADALFHLGRISESEAAFRRCLEIEPYKEPILHRFATLLTNTGRRWESRTHLLNLVRLGKFSIQELCLLADFELPIELDSMIETALHAVPDDPLPLLARARVKFRDNRPAEAGQMLWKVVRSRPDNLDAQGLLGEVLVASAAEPELQEWKTQLPQGAEKHPGVWFARGLWSEKNGRLEPAVRCYWEAIRIEPDHLRGNRHITRVLRSLGRDKFAVPFSRRADLLEKLNAAALDVYQVYDQSGTASLQLRQVPELSEELGRVWEAWAWNVVLIKQGFDEAGASRDRLRKLLDKENPPQTVTKFNPALQLDLTHYPLPE